MTEIMVPEEFVPYRLYSRENIPETVYGISLGANSVDEDFLLPVWKIGKVSVFYIE